MLDRIDRTRRGNFSLPPVRVVSSTLTPIPRPGRLAVDYDNDVLGRPGRGPLEELHSGTRVSATGTLTRVRFLGPQGGPVHAVLMDDSGESALVCFGRKAAARVRSVLVEGARVTVIGMVTAESLTAPAGIAGFEARLGDQR